MPATKAPQQVGTLASLRPTGVTQLDVAAAIGTTQKTISAWENGIDRPTQENRRRLADYYGEDIDTVDKAVDQTATLTDGTIPGRFFAWLLDPFVCRLSPTQAVA